MVKVRNGEEFGIDIDKVIAWTFIKDCSDQQDLTSSLQLLGYPVPALRVEERILVYVPGEVFIMAKSVVGLRVFTNFHNLLLSLFDTDLEAERSSE